MRSVCWVRSGGDRVCDQGSNGPGPTLKVITSSMCWLDWRGKEARNRLGKEGPSSAPATAAAKEKELRPRDSEKAESTVTSGVQEQGSQILTCAKCEASAVTSDNSSPWTWGRGWVSGRLRLTELNLCASARLRLCCPFWTQFWGTALRKGWGQMHYLEKAESHFGDDKPDTVSGCHAI